MSDNFVPIGEVADKFSVSKHTVRQWLRKGKIPEDMYVKIGNTYRYNLQGIENTFLSTNKEVSEVVEDATSEFEFGTEMLDEDF
jgi:excisionase family DNA binding protein